MALKRLGRTIDEYLQPNLTTGLDSLIASSKGQHAAYSGTLND